MAVAYTAPLTLLDPHNPDGARPYSGLHAVSPVLIGLAAPFVALLVLMPRSFANLGLVAFGILALIMLAAIVIFLHGVFTAGQIAAVSFNPEKRTVDIVETGMFSRSVTSLRFAEVAALRSNPHYDRDGYRYVTTDLVLRSGETIQLPMSPAPEQLAAVRDMLAGR